MVNNNMTYTLKDGTEKAAWLDIGQAVLSDSLFTQYMRKHGMTVNAKRNTTKDFIVVKFKYGVPEENISAKELRKKYYKNGITIQWPIYDKDTGQATYPYKPIKYKMLMRSPGKAKEGECIFVRDTLYDVAIKYLTMDLYTQMPEDNAKIVEMSAYMTLVTATAQDYIQIPMNQILIIKDEEVKADIPVWSVEVQDGRCVVNRDAKKGVSNILFDGEGLIDEGLFQNNILQKSMDGFIYCRSHFFKACLFRGNLQQFFKDKLNLSDDEYETRQVKDMFGNSLKLKDIKVVTTENAIKWIKFADIMGDSAQEAYQYYKRIMEEHGNLFAIVKTGHASKWGELQRASYQICNSLPISGTENAVNQTLTKIAQTSIDYCNNLKQDHSAFINYMRQEANDYNINNVLIALDEYNDSFKDTKYFREKKAKIISKLKKKMMLGKLLLEGDNLTICGNPIALLLKAIEKSPMEEQSFYVKKDVIQCYTPRFKDGEFLAGFRSPHNSPNNIVYLENTYSKELIKYFPNLGRNVIVINGIKTDVQDRLNGMDQDSDSVYVTNQEQIVEAAKVAYAKYPTIVNNIPLEGASIYKNDSESYALMDSKISSAQMSIGYSSNLAQMALSYYYDKYYRTNDKSSELEDIFVICSVLAQCAIDSAKRIYSVNINIELNKIRNMECMKEYCEKVNEENEEEEDNEEGDEDNEEERYVPKVPLFYAENQKSRGNKEGNYVVDTTIRCPMQILYDIINNGIDRQVPSQTVNIDKSLYWESNMRKAATLIKKNKGRRLKRILSIVKQYSKEVKTFNADEEEYFKKRSMAFSGCMKEIRRYKIDQEFMIYLIHLAFNNTDICDNLLIVLYNYDKNMFLKSFKETKMSKKDQKCPQNS